MTRRSGSKPREPKQAMGSKAQYRHRPDAAHLGRTLATNHLQELEPLPAPTPPRHPGWCTISPSNHIAFSGPCAITVGEIGDGAAWQGRVF